MNKTIDMAREAGFYMENSAAILAAQRFEALVRADEREQIEDEWSMRVQSDLEHGVRSLNEQAAKDWVKNYPEIAKFGAWLSARGERMNTLIERLKNPEDHYEFSDPKKANAVLMSLCQEAADALAAPVQEPEYWNVINPAGNIVASETDAIRGWARIAGSYKPTVEGLLGFHDQGWRVLPKVAPPAAQRQWVGLTDEEVMQTMSGDWTSQFYFARVIEAKLKEKNT